MRRHLITAFGMMLAVAVPAAAMDRYGTVVPASGRSLAAHDSDERLEALAAANSPNDAGHGKPAKRSASILKDDSQLQRAFGWLRNR